MKPVTYLEIGLVAFLALMILLPIGIVTVVQPAPSFTMAGDNPVRGILEKNGIQVINETDSRWNVDGALGGKIYTLVDSDGRETLVRTQVFQNDASCNAAIRTWHTHQAGRGRANGILIANGRHVTIISPGDRPVIEKIGQDLATGRLM